MAHAEQRAKVLKRLAARDRAPAALRDRQLVVDLAPGDIDVASGDPGAPRSSRTPNDDWSAAVGAGGASADRLAIHLAGEPRFEGAAFSRAQALGPEATIAALEEAGLQGRGGAGFASRTRRRTTSS